MAGSIGCCCCSMICAIVAGIMLSLRLDDAGAGRGQEGAWLIESAQMAQASQTQVQDSLVNSWISEPFTDIVVLNSLTDTRGCPTQYPDEVIYDLWPGTQQMCDCLAR